MVQALGIALATAILAVKTLTAPSPTPTPVFVPPSEVQEATFSTTPTDVIKVLPTLDPNNKDIQIDIQPTKIKTEIELQQEKERILEETKRLTEELEQSIKNTKSLETPKSTQSGTPLSPIR